MMKQNEKLHTEISQIVDRLNCSFVEAVLEFCEYHQYEPEDVVKQMDIFTKDRLKQSAIDERMVRKTIYTSYSIKLPLVSDANRFYLNFRSFLK